MLPISTSSFGVELCQVLKLNSKKVRTITIKVQPDDVILITTEQLLFVEEGQALLKMLEYYHLEPNKDENPIK
jgi:hypothetical protein